LQLLVLHSQFILGWWEGLSALLNDGDSSMTTPSEITLVQDAILRELGRSVSEEEDLGRMKLLLDELYRASDERELLASLL
jgi:hypothetical protein